MLVGFLKSEKLKEKGKGKGNQRGIYSLKKILLLIQVGITINASWEMILI